MVGRFLYLTRIKSIAVSVSYANLALDLVHNAQEVSPRFRVSFWHKGRFAFRDCEHSSLHFLSIQDCYGCAYPAQRAPISVSIYVKKIRSSCEMHNVPFGAPGSLPAFLNNLRENRHFAMDFWALGATMSADEGEEFSDERMFETVVYAIAGCDVGTVRGSRSDLNEYLDDLRDLLRGVDIDNPSRDPDGAETTPDSAAPEDSEVAPVKVISRIRPADSLQETIRTAGDRKRTEEAAISEAESKRGIHDESKAAPSSSDTITQSQLDETLLQLEQRYRGLMLYLDRLDKRMSALELQLDEQAAKIASIVAGTLPVPDEEVAPKPNYDGVVTQTVRKGETSRLVLTEPSAPEPQAEEFSTDNVLAGFSRHQPKRGDKIGIDIALLLVIATASFFIWKYHVPLQHRVAPLISKVTGLAVSDEAPAPEKATFPVSVAPSIGTEIHNAVKQATTFGSSDSGSDTSGSDTPSSSGAPQSENTPSSSRAPQPQEPHSHSTRSAEDYRLFAPSTPNDSQAGVSVPAYVMENNLITSRVPAYPEAAKAEGVQGRVLLQATISKEGEVEQLHVIDGDPVLRAAAMDAVSKWRYRPYTVNGRPVEVSTNIRVDFRLPNR